MTQCFDHGNVLMQGVSEVRKNTKKPVLVRLDDRLAGQLTDAVFVSGGIRLKQ